MNTINYELKKQNDRNQDILLQKDKEIIILKKQFESSKSKKDTITVK